MTTAGDDAARNFGLDAQPAHLTRYDRAAEFVEVSKKLWDSWDDDAIVADKESGVHARDDRVHAIDHVGPHFRVQGPLNVPRSPRATRCWFRRARRRTAGTSPPGTPTRCSPPSSPSRTPCLLRDVKRRALALGRESGPP